MSDKDEGVYFSRRVVAKSGSGSEEEEPMIKIPKDDDDPKSNEIPLQRQNIIGGGEDRKKAINLEISGDFKYHIRFVLVFFCSLPPVLNYTNRLTYFIVTFGFTTTYVFDFLRRPKFSFISFVLSVGFFLVTLYFQTLRMFFSFKISLNDLLVLLITFFYVFLISLYGSLQFQYFRKRMGVVKVYIERFLFGLTPFVTIPLIMTTLVEMNGITNAPFYLVVLIALEIHLFSGRIKPSFKIEDHYRIRKGVLTSKSVQYPIVSLMLVAYILVIPSVLYFAINIYTYKFDFFHSFNVLGLVSFGVFFVMVNPRNYLWFVRDRFYYCSFIFKIKFLQPCVLSISCCILFMFFEYRVIFNRYPHLLMLRFPYNFVFLNLSILLILILLMFVLNTKLNFYSSILQEIKRKKEKISGNGVKDENVSTYNKPKKDSEVGYKSLIFVSILCFVATSTLFIVLGFEMWAFPFFAMSLAGLTNFLMTFNWIHYCIFVCFSGISVIGWLFKNFGFLDLEMRFLFLPVNWTVNLKDVLVIIGYEYIFSLLLIPMVKMKNWYRIPAIIRFAAWGSHMVILAFLEEILYEQGDDLYSPFLVIFTSFCYLYMIYYINKRKVDSTDFYSSKKKYREYFGFNTFNFLFACGITKLVVLIDSPYQHKFKFISCFPFVFLLTRNVMVSFYRSRISQFSALAMTLGYSASVFLAKDVLWGPLFQTHSSMHVYEHSQIFLTRQLMKKAEFERITTQLELIKFNFSKHTGIMILQYLGNLVFGTEPKLFGAMVFIMGVGLLPLSHNTIIVEGLGFLREEPNREKVIYRNVLFRRFSFLILIMGFLWGCFEPIFSFNQRDLLLVPYLFLFSMLAFFGLVTRIFKLPRNNYMKLFIFNLISVTFGVCVAQLFFEDCYYHIQLSLPFSFFLVGTILCIAHFGKGSSERSVRSSGKSFAKKLCVVLYFAFILMIVFNYRTAVWFLPKWYSVEKMDQIRITMFGLFFIMNLFIGILLRFKIYGNPLIVDTSMVKFKYQQKENLDGKSSEELIDREVLLSHVVNFSTFASYFMGLFLVNWIFEDRQAYLFVTSLLILLPKENYEKMNKYLIITCLLQIKCVILFTLDLVVILIRHVQVHDESLGTLLSKILVHVCIFSVMFPTHIYIDALFLNYMKRRPNILLSLFFILLCSTIWFIEEIDSIKLFALIGILESSICVFIHLQWKKKKFISKNNQLIQ